MRELSFFAIVLGVVVGALLAAANAFIGLKTGMTVSASIPAAVVSLLVMRTLLRRGSLLESNMVQTIGSAGESVAAGMIFTIPALFIMGNDPQYIEMVAWGGIGGLLGVCFMVPLRRVLIVKEDSVLPYPEGVACAQVLQSGERGGASAKSVIWGGMIGAGYYLISALGFWKETGKVSISKFHTEAQLNASPALLGVGYILGPRIAAHMLAGAMLCWFVLIPSIGFFGASAVLPVHPESTGLIGSMSPTSIYEQYIRYIGAGAVAIGGLISLLKSIPSIVSSCGQVFSGLFRSGKHSKERTDRDFPILLLLAMVVGLGYAMVHFEQLGLNKHIIGVVAVIVFTFFFVTVSSRLVGLVGSSSSPVVGMTIATILATALVFRYFVAGEVGAVGPDNILSLRAMCLSIGAIVCVAISVAGDTSQDLKTGFLLKATPYKQQIGEMIGVLTSVVAIAGVILLLHSTLGFGEPTAEHPNPMLAPQANIMKMLVEGVLGGQVPWTLIMIGGAAAIIVELLGLSALPFAVGMYLPLGLSTPIMVGGIVHWLVKRKKRNESEHDTGLLASSGLVAGQGLMGITLAGVLAFMTWLWNDIRWFNPIGGRDGLGADEPLSYAQLVPWISSKIDVIPQKWGLSDAWWDALPLMPFVPVVIWLWWHARKRPPIIPPAPQPIAPEPEPLIPPTDDEPHGPPVPPPPPDTYAVSSESTSEVSDVKAPTTSVKPASSEVSSTAKPLLAPVIEPIAAKFGPPQQIITQEQEQEHEHEHEHEHEETDETHTTSPVEKERTVADSDEVEEVTEVVPMKEAASIEAVEEEIPADGLVDRSAVYEPKLGVAQDDSTVLDEVHDDTAPSAALDMHDDNMTPFEEAEDTLKDEAAADEDEHDKLLRRIGGRDDIAKPAGLFTPSENQQVDISTDENLTDSADQTEPSNDEEMSADAGQLDDEKTKDVNDENSAAQDDAQMPTDPPSTPDWPETGPSFSPYKPKFRAGKPDEEPDQSEEST